MVIIMLVRTWMHEHICNFDSGQRRRFGDKEWMSKLTSDQVQESEERSALGHCGMSISIVVKVGGGN